MVDTNSFSETPEDLKTRLTKPRSVRRFALLHDLLRYFTPGERLALYALTITLSISTLALVAGANAAVSIDVPARGGSLTEGLLGPARFINPVLTTTEADESITKLVYAGLTRIQPDGSIIPDMAESFSISEDGTTYTFTMRSNATFHDGKPLTSADVVYSVKLAQNPETRSPHRADWEGVEVSAPDPQTVTFTLPRAYAPFLENTSMGILPEHLWRDIPAAEVPFSPLNTRPIGSGPYAVDAVETDNTGAAVRYELVPAGNFPLGNPYLKRITFLFYRNEDTMMRAFEDGDINAVAGASPAQLALLNRDNVQVTTAVLPRVFSIFFNQTHAPILSDLAVRRALDTVIDKRRLVDMALDGYGVPLDGPVPPGILSPYTAEVNPNAHATESAHTEETIAAAREILSRGGWKYSEETGTWSKGDQTLGLTLSTADAPELVATANAVATAWRALGVQVTVQVYPVAELNISVIRPRSYDAVLFGEVIGRELDLFAFWHSSQRNDPGLNLALYINARTDSLLSQARTTTDRKEREKLYSQFSDIVKEDTPAVFLYAPVFIYLLPGNLHGIDVGVLTSPSERFLNAHQWYIDRERVWSIFTNRETII